MDTTHVFKPMIIARLAACVVCKKPFSGFLSSGVKCQGNIDFNHQCYTLYGYINKTVLYIRSFSVINFHLRYITSNFNL